MWYKNFIINFCKIFCVIERDLEPTLVNRINEAPSSAVTENSVFSSTQSVKGNFYSILIFFFLLLSSIVDNPTTVLATQLNLNTTFIEPDNLQIHEQTDLINSNQEKQSINLGWY